MRRTVAAVLGGLFVVIVLGGAEARGVDFRWQENSYPFREASNTPTIRLRDFDGDGHIDIAVYQISLNVYDNIPPLIIRFNSGNGQFFESFKTVNNFLIPSDPPEMADAVSNVEPADIDKDGKSDLVAICHDKSIRKCITVRKGTGRGTYRTEPIYSFFPSSLGYGNYGFDSNFVLEDFNGDGNLDIAVCLGELNGPPPCLAILYGPLSGQGGPREFYDLPYSPYTYSNTKNINQLTTGDFNGDGIIDIAGLGPLYNNAVSGSAGVCVFLGLPGGGLGERRDHYLQGEEGQIVLGRRSPAVAGDFNGDGRSDLAIAAPFGPVRVIDKTIRYTGTATCVLLADEDGSFQPPRWYYSEDWIGPDDGTETTWDWADTGDSCSVFAADFDGDGLCDIVQRLAGPMIWDDSDEWSDKWPFCAKACQILFGRSDGLMTEAVVTAPGMASGNIACADLDGDSRPDLVVPHHLSQMDPWHMGIYTFGVKVYLNRMPQSNAAPRIQLTGPSSGIAVHAGDIVPISWLDGDDDDNAVITLSAGSFDGPAPWGFVNAGYTPSGSPDPAETAPFGYLDAQHLIADGLNENDDAAGGSFAWDTSGTEPGVYTVWASIDDGVNAPRYSRAAGRVTIMPPEHPAWRVRRQRAGLNCAYGEPEVFDLDRDGAEDLVLVNTSEACIDIFLGLPGGHLGERHSIFLNSPVEKVVMGNFNGDGVPDLAFMCSGFDTVTFLRGDGSGGYTCAGQYNVAPADSDGLGRNMITMDFDGNGIDDVAVFVYLDSTHGLWTVLYMGSDGSPERMEAAPENVRYLRVGDYNGDGSMDMLAKVDGQLMVLYGEPGAGLGSTVAPFDTGFEYGDVEFYRKPGDFNGDGCSDLLGRLRSEETFLIYKGRKDGGFDEAVELPWPAPGHYSVGGVAVGDVNGDGLDDIVTVINGYWTEDTWNDCYDTRGRLRLSLPGGGFSEEYDWQLPDKANLDAVFADISPAMGPAFITTSVSPVGEVNFNFYFGYGGDFSADSTADSDSDGLADWWEQEHFGDLSQDGGGDYDGDGVTNADEEAAGSDPCGGADNEGPTVRSLSGSPVLVQIPAAGSSADVGADGRSRPVVKE